MPIFFGRSETVVSSKILAVVDYAYFQEGSNQEFFANMADKSLVYDMTEGEAPKSVIITEDKIYIYSLSALAIKKRSDRIHNLMKKKTPSEDLAFTLES